VTLPARKPTFDPPDAPDGALSTELALLLTQLSHEAAQPLTEALDRMQSLLRTVDAGSAARLSMIREPMRRARDAVLLASQIGRLASGRVRPARDPVALHASVHQVAEQRRREAMARGLQIRTQLLAAEAEADQALVNSLLHALLDWALWHTRSSIELSLVLTPWPVRSRLECRFAFRDLDQFDAPVQLPKLDDLRWRLVQQLCEVLGLECQRLDEGGVSVTRIDFPVPQLKEWVAQIDLSRTDIDPGLNTQPFAGMHALLLSADPGLVGEILPILERLGWTVDTVASVDEAFQLCLDGLPQAVVTDAVLRGPDLDQWCTHVMAEAPSLCFVEVVSADSAALPFARTRGLQRCQRERLSQDLPVLLRAALEPGEQALTLRL
jgi:hypothetical protein